MDPISRRATLALAIGALTGCAITPPSARRPFVLVHGAWHDAGCWAPVVPLLRNAGHAVAAIDLPGHGTRRAEAATLASYAAAVQAAVEASGGQAVVVGHSMGGLPVTLACEAAAGKVHAAVFLAAFLVPSRGSLRAYSERPENAGSRLPAALRPLPAEQRIVIRPEAARDAFYNDCDDATVAAAVAALQPQAMQPLGAPVTWSAGGFGSVRRVYIKTLRDQAVMPSLQQRMVEDTDTRELLSLDSSHSPFLSRPAELAKLLLRVAA